MLSKKMSARLSVNCITVGAIDGCIVFVVISLGYSISGDLEEKCRIPSARNKIQFKKIGGEDWRKFLKVGCSPSSSAIV